jgi:hypothetical protein
LSCGRAERSRFSIDASFREDPSQVQTTSPAIPSDFFVKRHRAITAYWSPHEIP